MRKFLCRIKKVFFLFSGSSGLTWALGFLLIINASLGHAQDEGGDIFKETFSDLSMIGYMGVGGAILGLSTLSFVDQPSKNLKNIVVGGAIGIIVGVGVVAWKQATKSQDSYGIIEQDFTKVALMDISQTLTESNKDERFSTERVGMPIAFNWNFNF